MSKRWGGDYAVTEHRDLQANTMAVDATGSYVLLAGRRCFAVKNLNDPMDGLGKFQRQSKYQVGSAEWNPTMKNCHLCAISSNTRVEILSFAGASGQELQTTHSLRGHTRVVSDLNWHPKEPDIIASCSIDTFIHIWDIRDQRRPCLSLSAVAGSSQVRWNGLSPYTLATAHDGDVKIWDQRKGNSPVQYIAAHLTKIHGLDWCPFQHNQLATSSQDCTVKIFDITNPRRVESILTTNSPVWRARYTPFGEGLVTIVVPQLRRGENSLLLWNTSNFNSPIYTFVGHTDVVLEFQWRHPTTDTNDYELITWSKDQCLRIFKIDAFVKKLCGRQDMDDETTSVYTQFIPPQDTNMTSLRSVQQMQLNGQRNETDVNCVTSKPEGSAMTHHHHQVGAFPDDDKQVQSPTQPKTLQQEFSLININIPNIEINAMDALERSCTVTACNKNYNVILKVNFPSNYPRSAQPTFQFCPGTTVDNPTMAKLLKVLKQTAQQRVRKNRSCLEPCLRQLIITLEQTCVKDSESETTHLTAAAAAAAAAAGAAYRAQRNDDFLNSTNICTNYQDTYIPFPRTSGAKFSCVGSLVCFGRSSYPRRASIKPEGSTPRALSALATGMVNGVAASPFMNIYPNSYGQSSDAVVSISSFYFQDRKGLRKILHGSNRSQSSRSSYKNHYSTVTIYDASSLFFVSKDLAEKYVINITDIPGMCQYNANIAATLERPDLVQAWCLAALVISQPLSTAAIHHNMCQSPADIDAAAAPWPFHPFGQNLIHSLIQHYASQSDIQMAGMLSCAFSYRSENPDVNQSRIVSSKSVNVSRLFTGKWWSKPGSSPYHTIHPADTSLDGWNFQNLKQHRSNSWSESLDELKVIEDGSGGGGGGGETVRNIRLLDEKYTILYDSYKKAYAEVLHRWRLLDARAQVLKHVSSTSSTSNNSGNGTADGHNYTYKDVEFQSECHICDKVSRGPQCSSCKRFNFQCVICHISVRGPSNLCIVCGHGGHTSHLAAWFTTETLCPTGCGCCCVQETTTLFSTC